MAQTRHALRTQETDFQESEGIENDEEPDVFMDDIGELQEQQERERELRFQRMLVEMQGDEDLDKDGGVNASSASESLELIGTSCLISTDFTSLKEIKRNRKRNSVFRM